MIYVDNARNKFGRMWMSHLFAVPVNNTRLHQFAAGIGLKRNWFQGRGGTPHYDVCASMRLRAVKAGAKPVTVRAGGSLRVAATK